MKDLFIIFICIHLAISCKPRIDHNDNLAGIEQVNITKNITIQDAQKLISDRKDIVILDVRTPEEVSAGTIPNTTVINITDPEFSSKINSLDKSKPILVYCKAGGRSAKACSMMEKIGFKELYNLKEGYDGWSKSLNK